MLRVRAPATHATRPPAVLGNKLIFYTIDTSSATCLVLCPVKTPLGHRTLSAAIVEQLRQDILDGTYAAGAQLRQDALATTFQVSRIPIREALIQLEAEGLVRIEPHKGAIVSAFSLEEIDDVFDLRVLLEPRMLAQSAPRLTPQDCAEIAALDAAFARAIAEQDVAQWGQLNARFHLALYRHARQPRTLAIVTSLLQTSDRFTRLQMNRAPALDRAGREHRHLLRLCKDGKAAQAGDYLVAHIEKVRQDLHDLLKRDARTGTTRRQAGPERQARVGKNSPPSPSRRVRSGEAGRS